MNRLSIVTRNLLTTAVLALGLSLAIGSTTGCALENNSADSQGAENGTDDLVEGAKDDPTIVHSGTSGNVALKLSPGDGIHSAPPVLETGGGSEGPQPEPWEPQYAIHATSTKGSSNNK